MSNYGTKKMLEAVKFALEAFTEEGRDENAAMMRNALEAYKHYHGGNPEKCDECGSRLKYQGWENYETWELALELDNDEHLQDEANRIVLEAGNLNDAADAMKDWVKNMVDEHLQMQGLKGGLSDVPFYNLYRMDSVNWREVAAHFIPDEFYGRESWDDVEEDEA